LPKASAVRYWAGNAVCKIVPAARLNNNFQAQQVLMKALVDAIAKESDARVTNAMLKGLACLTDPQAAAKLMEVLDARIVVHLRRPGQLIAAERDAIRQLSGNVIQRGAENVPAETKQQLARLVFRYMSLAVLNATKHNPPDDVERVLGDMFRLGDSVLRWAVVALNPALQAQLPPPIQAIGDKLNWPVMDDLLNRQWKALLTQLGIADLDLPNVEG